MATDDKKEYRDTLEMLDHTGSGSAVLNKLSKLAIKVEDPRLKKALDIVSSALHSTPDFRHLEKVRFLSWSANYSVINTSKKQTAENILVIEKYCRDQIASQIPQWQSIALAAGWTPPQSAA